MMAQNPDLREYQERLAKLTDAELDNLMTCEYMNDSFSWKFCRMEEEWKKRNPGRRWF